MSQKRLVVVVEGNASLAPSWPTLRKDYVEKIVRAFAVHDGAVQKGVGVAEMALVVFYSHGPHSECLLQQSVWTSSVDEYIRWLESVSFAGGSVGGASITEGLAEALSMCLTASAESSSLNPGSSPLVGGSTLSGASSVNREQENHCVLVAASYPYRFPTPVPKPPHPALLGESGIGDQWWTADFTQVAQLFRPCGVSLSVIAPRQITILKNIFNVARSQQMGDSMEMMAPKQQHLVLLSDAFGAAKSVLQRGAPVASSMNESHLQKPSVMPVQSMNMSGSMPVGAGSGPMVSGQEAGMVGIPASNGVAAVGSAGGLSTDTKRGLSDRIQATNPSASPSGNMSMLVKKQEVINPSPLVVSSPPQNTGMWSTNIPMGRVGAMGGNNTMSGTALPTQVSSSSGGGAATGMAAIGASSYGGGVVMHAGTVSGGGGMTDVSMAAAVGGSNSGSMRATGKTATMMANLRANSGNESGIVGTMGEVMWGSVGSSMGSYTVGSSSGTFSNGAAGTMGAAPRLVAAGPAGAGGTMSNLDGGTRGGVGIASATGNNMGISNAGIPLVSSSSMGVGMGVNMGSNIAVNMGMPFSGSLGGGPNMAPTIGSVASGPARAATGIPMGVGASGNMIGSVPGNSLTGSMSQIGGLGLSKGLQGPGSGPGLVTSGIAQSGGPLPSQGPGTIGQTMQPLGNIASQSSGLVMAPGGAREGMVSEAGSSTLPVQPSNHPPQGVSGVKFWTGPLQIAKKDGSTVTLCVVEALRRTTSPDTLGADWPDVLQIVRIWEQAKYARILENKSIKPEIIMFRPLDNHNLFQAMIDRKQGAFVQLRSHTLLLEPQAPKADKWGSGIRLVGVLLSKQPQHQDSAARSSGQVQQQVQGSSQTSSQGSGQMGGQVIGQKMGQSAAGQMSGPLHSHLQTTTQSLSSGGNNTHSMMHMPSGPGPAGAVMSNNGMSLSAMSGGAGGGNNMMSGNAVMGMSQLPNAGISSAGMLSSGLSGSGVGIANAALNSPPLDPTTLGSMAGGMAAATASTLGMGAGSSGLMAVTGGGLTGAGVGLASSGGGGLGLTTSSSALSGLTSFGGNGLTSGTGSELPSSSGGSSTAGGTIAAGGGMMVMGGGMNPSTSIPPISAGMARTTAAGMSSPPLAVPQGLAGTSGLTMAGASALNAPHSSATLSSASTLAAAGLGGQVMGPGQLPGPQGRSQLQGGIPSLPGNGSGLQGNGYIR